MAFKGLFRQLEDEFEDYVKTAVFGFKSGSF